MALDGNNVVKKVFIQRARVYYDNVEQHRPNPHGSIVYDILNTVYIFDLCETVKNMIYRDQIWSKVHRDKVWKRAWELDDIYWCIKARV